MIVQVGPYPEPVGGVSIYIKRMKEYMDLQGISNEVWDISSIKKNVPGVENVRLRYVPLRLLYKDDIKLVHYNICGIGQKLYIGALNKLFFKKTKKILTIHGESSELFTKGNIILHSINSFDHIICVKAGDRDYLEKMGVKKPVHEIPAFITPLGEETKIPEYILEFMNSRDFIITANASCIQFHNDCDLYGIDMCIELMTRLKNNNINAGLVFFLPNINDIKYFNKLKKSINERNIESSFIFVNEKMELYPVIKRSRLFIRPTCNDGYGVSIAEAIFQNIPAIASDVCERPKGTVLFKSRDIDDLYKKTIDVMENYYEYKGKIKNIKLQSSEKNILKLYEACL